MIDFFLNDVRVYLVEASHISGNPASGKIMEKSGMKKEGVLKSRRMIVVTNELNDIIVYYIHK